MALFLALALLSRCAVRVQPKTMRNMKIASGMTERAELLPVYMYRRESVGWGASSVDHIDESRTRLMSIGAMMSRLTQFFSRCE
jgi:hypothetical protein